MSAIDSSLQSSIPASQDDDPPRVDRSPSTAPPPPSTLTLSARAIVRKGALGVFRVLNRGDRHQCPCCGSTFTRFVKRGPNYMCPACRSWERHRVLTMYLENETDVFDAGARVLHLAPEPSLYRRLHSEPKLICTTGDLRPGPDIDVELDARDLPFDDASFDLVICSHVLEHIVEDTQVASEFARVLKPTGQALIMIPVDHSRATTYESPQVQTPAQRAAVYGHPEHARIYGLDAIERLRAGGFTVDCIPYADRLAPELQWRFLLRSRGRRRGEDIYRCTPSTAAAAPREALGNFRQSPRSTRSPPCVRGRRAGSPRCRASARSRCSPPPRRTAACPARRPRSHGG